MIRKSKVCFALSCLTFLKEYVKKYATKEDYEAAESEDDEDEEMSSIDSFSDEETAGNMDE
jgi:hypothetical protein